SDLQSTMHPSCGGDKAAFRQRWSAAPSPDFSGCHDRSAPKRTLWAAMERHGLRQWRNQPRTFRRPWSYQPVQDGILREADPDGSIASRDAEGVEESDALL